MSTPAKHIPSPGVERRSDFQRLLSAYTQLAQLRGDIPTLDPVSASVTGVTPPGIARRLYTAVHPYGYGDLEPGGLRRRDRLLYAFLGKDLEKNPTKVTPDRDDAWRLYLGMPQVHGTFTMSKFKPSQSKDPFATYFSFSDSINHLFSSANAVGLTGRNTPERIREVVETIDKVKTWGDPQFSGIDVGTMAGFKWDKGEDERGTYLSYYDKWDLSANPMEAGSPENVNFTESDLGTALVPPNEARILRRLLGPVGRPFEIYGRIYYDPKTFEPIKPKEVEPKELPLPKRRTRR